MGVGVTRAVVVGMYVGTAATAGLVGVEGGVKRGRVGDIGGVWVMGDTTLTGLCGFGRTNGGGGLTVVEEGRLEHFFWIGAPSFESPAGGDDGFVSGLEGAEDGGAGVVTSLDDGEAADTGKGAGEAVSLGEVEEEELFWTGLSGGAVREEVTAGSGGVGTVCTTITAGEAPSTVNTKTERRMKQVLPHIWVDLEHNPCHALPFESKLTGAEQLLCGP